MSTVSHPAAFYQTEGNAPQFARTSCLPDEAFSEDAIQASDLDALHHEMSIDFGDDAVNADAAIAETTILTRYPAADYVSVKRTQRRRLAHGVADFSAEWDVYVGIGERTEFASGSDLDKAVAAVLAKLTEPLAA